MSNMQLYRSMEGFIFSFGFNMQTRRPDPRYIGWCDPTTKQWDATAANQAGYIVMPFFISPQKIEQRCGGQIIVHQSDYIIVLADHGPPLMWGFTPYTPEHAVRLGIIFAAPIEAETVA